MRDMRLLLRRVDRLVEVVTDWVSSFLLLMLTLVILYSVVMRYVFSQPPFWSDIVSMFANVAMIMIGLSLTIRGRDLIAMQAIYEKVSPALALTLDATWNALILVFAIVFTWYGFEAATQVPGFYWELGMLPQKYPMMIVPVSGVLLIIASLGILIKDICRYIESDSGGRKPPLTGPEG